MAICVIVLAGDNHMPLNGPVSTEGCVRKCIQSLRVHKQASFLAHEGTHEHDHV